MSQKKAEHATPSTTPSSPAQANATTSQQIATMEAEGQAQDASATDGPTTDTPATGGASTPAADAHEAALDQEVDTFGVVTPVKGAVS